MFSMPSTILQQWLIPEPLLILKDPLGLSILKVALLLILHRKRMRSTKQQRRRHKTQALQSLHHQFLVPIRHPHLRRDILHTIDQHLDKPNDRLFQNSEQTLKSHCDLMQTYL
jgi:hypothetical protein